MPKMIIRFRDSGLTKQEAKEFATEHSADLSAYSNDSKSKQSFLIPTILKPGKPPKSLLEHVTKVLGFSNV